MNSIKNNFPFIKNDLASGLVVFLIALPLCLGIALASGAPLFSGLISGIIGGVVIGYFSKSALSVSGPAAGLTAIVLSAITELGAFDIFLCAVILAGFLQIILGFLRAGSISYYFPSNVIEGMLAAIGIIIILNQLEHAIGVGGIAREEEEFKLISLIKILKEGLHHWGALVIALFSIGLLILWERPIMKSFRFIPAALVVVVSGILLNELFLAAVPSLAITDSSMLVNIPVIDSSAAFFSSFTAPDLRGFLNPDVWAISATIAVVASIETLLCIEATDKLDPLKRKTPTNRELQAQGIGNIISGLIGGLPVTSVIVRSSANINSGGKTKLSTITHGIFLLLSVLIMPFLLNKIPLATLAAILIITGYKLAKPAVFKRMWLEGKWQFMPFIATVVMIVATDLLKGVALGMVVSIIFLLRQNAKNAYYFHRSKYRNGDVIKIELSDEVSFLNKASILLTLEHLPAESTVIIDASKTVFIDHDVLDIIREFKDFRCRDKNINLSLTGFKEKYEIENHDHISYLHTDMRDAKELPKRSRGSNKQLLKELIVTNNH